MNAENLDYLKEQLKYTGFGEGLNAQLEAAVAKKEPQFQLTFESEIGGKAFVALLHFRRSEQTDRYYFNSYHASLQQSNGEIVDQAFYLNNGRGVTAKEAYNLLDGRAVYKELQNREGQPYHAWLQLDFEKKDKHNNHEVKQFHEGYGYNLKEAVGRLAIPDLDGGDREKSLLYSLQKGNLQSVSIEKEGSVTMAFVEANPQYKTVNLYDHELKRVPKENIGAYLKNEPGQGADRKVGAREGLKEPAGEKVDRSQKGPSRKNGRSAGH